MIKARQPRHGEWPFPYDTQLDQARTVARDLYRLYALDRPDRAAEYAATARTRFGVTWLTPQPDTTDPGRFLTSAEVAAIGHVQPRAVSQWTTRGIVRAGRRVKLTRYPDGFDEPEVYDFIALLRNRRP